MGRFGASIALGLALAFVGCDSGDDPKGTGQGDTGASVDTAVGADTATAVDTGTTSDSGGPGVDVVVDLDAGASDSGGAPDVVEAVDVVDAGPAPVDVSGPADTGAPVDVPQAVDVASPTFEMDENGCLTFAGASALCGAASDDSVCGLAATCRPDGDESQCNIDCEMSPTVGCLDQAAIDCVLDATAKGACQDLAGCAGWYLVY